MKTKILLFALLLSSFIIKAQSPPFGTQIIYGEEVDSKKSVVEDFIGEDNENYYFLMSKKGKLHIDKYNKKLSLSKSTEIIQRRDDIYLFHERTIFANENIIVFYSQFDRKADTKTLYYEVFSTSTLQSKGKLEQIAQIEDIKRSNRGNFSVILSPEKTKILVYMDLLYEKDGPEKYNFKVFDNQMVKVWEKDVTLPYADRYFTITGYKVDEEGNSYILGKYYDNEDKVKGSSYKKYEYHLLAYNGKEDVENDYIIKLDDKVITDFTFTPKSKEIICAGFYSEVGLHSIKGVFYLRLDEESGSIISSNKKEFGIDFITEGMSEKRTEKTKKKADKGKNIELYEYDLDELILREDGGCVLLAEQYYVDVVTTYYTNANGTTSTSTTYHYYYNSILAININPNGEIDWNKKIIKNQHSVNDGGRFSSYVSFVTDEYIYFVYNENSKNRDVADPRDYKNYSPSQKYTDIVIARVNSEGYIDKKVMVKAEDAETMIRPKLSVQINDTELILFSMKKKTYQFTKVVFN